MRINDESGLPSNVCNDIKIDDAGDVWVGTGNGLVRIQKAKEKTKSTPFDLQVFTINDGLVSNEINKLDIAGDMVYVATSNGYSELYVPGLAVENTPPLIHLEELLIWDQKTALDSNLAFSHTNNDLEFKFTGLAFKSRDKLQYRYKLKGLEEKWNKTSQTSIRYPQVPPGEYVFEVYVIDDDGNESLAPAQFKFEILKPFWQKLWFIVAVLLLLIGITWGVSALWFRNVRKRIEYRHKLNQRLLESEQKALRAQMNPHFIFNCLTSIQRFISQQDKKAAMSYLAKFAKLIRKTLDQTRKSSLSLSEEISTLELYLDLESLRFKNKLDYHINCDENINTDLVRLPCMLVQPYVENAIKHGILHKKTNGLVTIDFHIKNDILVCCVTDNGVGRVRSQELNSRNPEKKAHKSHGMTVTAERIELLSVSGGNDLSATITDLYNDASEAMGTQVVLTIPLD